jgi:predicted transcriptional regulator
MVYAMLEVDAQKDWWDEIQEDAKKSIKRGLDDAKKGKVRTHEEVMKKYKKWLL